MIADADEIDEKCCGVANLVNGPTGAVVLALGGNLVPDSAFAREQYYDFDPTNKIDNSGISMQVDIDLPNEMLLTSITSYRTLDRLENADVDFTSAALISRNITDIEIETFTQELRLSYAGERVNWLVGGFYFDEDVSQTTDIDYGTAFRLYLDIPTGFGVTGIEQALNLPSGTLLGVNQGAFESAGQDLSLIHI